MLIFISKFSVFADFLNLSFQFLYIQLSKPYCFSFSVSLLFSLFEFDLKVNVISIIKLTFQIQLDSIGSHENPNLVPP